MNVQGRKRTLTVGLGGAIVLALAAWIIGGQIRSPAQIAAETSAPDPSAITVPVEQRVLSSDVIVRGTVRYGSPQPVVLATSESKQSNASTSPTDIVTTAPRRGARVGEGSVAMTISGRPGLRAARRTGVPPRPGPRQARPRRAPARDRAQPHGFLPGQDRRPLRRRDRLRRRLLLREAGLGAVRADQRPARAAARRAVGRHRRRETHFCRAAW